MSKATLKQWIILCIFILVCGFGHASSDKQTEADSSAKLISSVQLGPRPFFLIDTMDEGLLKSELQSCQNGPFKPSKFSIGHRGAPLQFPEHTEESYRAASLMGAGILECYVTFPKDKVLVCRHS